MKLIVGLGNIGPHYVNTRHNTGFAVVEAYASHNGMEWSDKRAFKAHIAEGNVHGEKIILAQPTTYYNLSGEAVRAIKDFYKIDNQDILVVHDELDLPYGTIRVRHGGSDAGNNGIKSIITHVGDDFSRIRIGIANERAATIDAADFVLSRFNSEEVAQWPDIMHHAQDAINRFIDPHQKLEHTSVRVSAE
jgi:peptidyl-tRNA hydrolase, PTH1 family